VSAREMADKVDVLAGNYSETLSSSVSAYLTELAHEILSGGDPDGDFATELAAAHTRRQAMAKEMAHGRSERAQMARRVLAAQVYGNIRAAANVESAMQSLAFTFRPDTNHAEAVAKLEGYALATLGGSR